MTDQAAPIAAHYAVRLSVRVDRPESRGALALDPNDDALVSIDYPAAAVVELERVEVGE